MAEQSDRRLILVTAFEPSGDLHAAPVIAALKARCPDWEIVAWGGAHMEAAGATLMQNTASDGVMGLAGITRANEIRKIHQEILRWGEHRKVIVHLAVDSPSANLPLSAKLKLRGTRVLNLVAPQLWAWGEWRANRVRRISDGLLCLLPFEERWFRERQFVAKYVGHPVLSQPLDLDVVKQDREGLPPGGPRILLLPGSRTNEIRANAKLIVRAFELIQSRHRSAVATVVATTESNARLFREQFERLPSAVHVKVGGLEGAIDWSELALAVSGTVSLDLARQAKPMVGVYRTSLFSVILGKFVLKAPYRLLPNIVAGREIVPEFVPYSGGPEKVAAAALEILGDGRKRAQASDDLRRVANSFGDRDPGLLASLAVEHLARTGSITNAALDSIVASKGLPGDQSELTVTHS
jgi:lipid-A-disaccharide synthase